MKTCTKCKLNKSLDSFYKNSASKDGLYTYCKPCAADYSKAWREANREHKAAYSKAWREANREHKAAYAKAWREANKERDAAVSKAWRESNPDRSTYYNRRRRARKRCVVTEVDLPCDADLIAAAGGVCAICGQEPDSWHIDHIWPLSRGGPHIRENLQAVCDRCNTSKQNSLPDDTYPYPSWYDPNVIAACVEMALEEDHNGILHTVTD